MIRKKVNKFILILIYIIIGFCLILGFNNKLEETLKLNYIIDVIAYYLMAGIFVVIFIKSDMDIFEPLVLISVIYIIMFTILPIIDIKMNQILWFGVNLFEYGIKGTFIVILGYISFVVGYLNIKKNKKIVRQKQYNYSRKRIIQSCLVIWGACMILSLIYLVLSGGLSLKYIFTLGINGSTNISGRTDTPLGAVSMFSYSLIPTFLIYFNFGDSKFIKLVMFFCTTMIQLIRGFRFIVIILIVSLFFLYYLKKKKRPKPIVILPVLLLIFILIGIIGFYRNAIRTGHSVAWSDFKWNDITEAILGNFRIYKTYYGVIKAVPDLTPHLYGSQMIIYTLIMFIPRVIWPNKPMPNGGEAIRLGISDYAARAGQAYPSIGEYYYEFGFVGVIVCMWLFGFLMKNIKNKYLISDTNDFNLIKYSILVPTTFQVMIRGYMPSNFYLIIFLIVPVIVVERYSRIRNKLR